MSMISVIGIAKETAVDGIGLRASLYGAGCPHACNGCHNPQSWDINNGTWFSVQDIFDRLNIAGSVLLSGITFSGGEPMSQPGAFCELAQMVKTIPNRDVWCYTGYLFEDLISNRDEKYELLTHVDVLVDGKYISELRDITLAFRGSSNQRIIDVKESLKQNTIVEHVEYY